PGNRTSSTAACIRSSSCAAARCIRCCAPRRRALAPSRRQLEQFKHDGFLHLPELFSAGEARALKREALRLSLPAKENTLEPDGSAVRAALGVQHRSVLFARLARHPRLVLLARHLLGGEVYLHQLKVNYKVAFDGAAWDWHQDFDTWHRVDGMPRP